MLSEAKSRSAGNGRLYDPLVGRFLSPDNFVQAPDFTQSFNRYAYCINNPLIYTDPSGEFIFTLACLLIPGAQVLLPFAIAADVGGIINTTTNWKNIDNVGEGLAAYGLGAGTGVLSFANPALGAILGGAITQGGNDIIRQTGKGVGLSDIDWGKVGEQALIGVAVGSVTYGMGAAISQTGVTNKILDATGITNNVARNIAGSTINGVMTGTTVGLVRGVGNGLVTGDWNVWEYTWKGAAYGGVGGLLYGGLTELGYQAQLKYGHSDALNSRNTDIFAKGGQRFINRLQRIVGNNSGTGSSMNGQGMGEIIVVYNTQTGTTTVYINVSPNSYWQPPSPYQYNSPTIYQNILRLNK